MRLLDRLVILFLNLCLLALAILAPALALAKSPAFYSRTLRATGIYESEGVRTPIRYIGGKSGAVARFTDAQLDAITAHIIDYLFGDTEEFALVLDGVELNGRAKDGVSVFGDAAIAHMKDVKALMRLAGGVAIASAAFLPFLFLYLYKRRSARRIALRYTLILYAAILLLAALFLLISYSHSGGDFANTLWNDLHRLFFPFRPEKVEGSFFNDALTSILTVPFFMSAVLRVVAVLLAVLAAWLVTVILFRRRAK